MRSVVCLALLSCLLGGLSCKRVKETLGKVRSEVRSSVEGSAKEEEGSDVVVLGEKADEELGKLVDQNGDGYLFRRDLPFPDHVRCRISSKVEYENARIFKRDVFGDTAVALKGGVEMGYTVERDGGVLRVVVDRYRRIAKSAEEVAEDVAEGVVQEVAEGGGEAKPDEGVLRSLEGVEGVFARQEEGWKWRRGSSDFRLMAWGGDLEKTIEYQLQDWAVIPRSPWFSSTRLQPGAELSLKDGQIGLVTGTSVKDGELKLRFERIEAVDGHPCAVFAWSGELSSKAPNLEGEMVEEDLSVEAGKIWCSLLYPLVLHQEFKGLMTTVIRNPKGGLKQRIQGGITVVESRVWEPLKDLRPSGSTS